MDQFFDNLDELIREERIEVELCCDNIKNYQIYQGTTICSKCKNTITNIQENPEWRYYGACDTKSCDPTRCGMPINKLLPESSIGTSISFKKNNQTMNKLRKYQQWNGMPYKERSLFKVFQEISRVCKKGDLSMIIVNEANSLYKIVSTTKISRGSNRQGIIAACVYFSCKINNVPRSPNEIASIFDLQIPVMTKGCKKFQEIMQLNKVNINRIHCTDTISMDDFIDRFCTKLDLQSEDILIIKDISKMAQLYNLVNENTPPSMAAGCIYLYIKDNELNIHKKQIADICKISEVTINKCYKKLEPYLSKLIV